MARQPTPNPRPNVAPTPPGTKTLSRSQTEGAARATEQAYLRAQARAREQAQAPAPVSRAASPDPVPVDYGNYTPSDYSPVDEAPVAPVYAPPTDAELQKSTGYLARDKALNDALAMFTAQQNTDSTRYGIDYGKSLEKLGYTAPAGSTDAGAAGGMWDAGNGYNERGVDTVSGRAFRNQLNDFASRGLSQSGMFSAANSVLRNQLNDQLGSMNSAKSNFSADQVTKLAGLQGEQTAARVAALKEAKDAALNAHLQQTLGL